jgi:hypothetical protein
MVRPTALVILGVVALGCGQTPGADAGVDAGSSDSGFDAGPMPVCLPDTLDAGSGDAGADAGWDGGYDFSCRGRVPAPGGQAELLVGGKAIRAGFTRTPLEGIRLDLLRADGTLLATTSSDDAGVYQLTFDAGCAPLDGEVRATHPSPDAGFYLSYAVPAAPWRYDRGGLQLLMFDVSTRNLVAALSNVTLVNDTAVLALSVEDCEGNPVEGVILTTGDAGVVRYVSAAGVPSSALTTTGPSGDAVIFNLPGASVTVVATLDAGLISQRTVPVHANAATGTTLLP